MLLLVGHVPRAFQGREAWQEIDYASVFGGDREGGLAGRHAPSAFPSTSRAPSRSRSPAGRGPSCSRCPRTCSRRRPRSRTPRRCGSPAPAPRAGGARAPARAPRRRRAAARRRRRGRLDAADRRGRARVLRGERAARRVRVPLPGLRRQPLAVLRGRPRRGDGRRGSPPASPTPTSCSRSAAGSARCRRAATRCSSRRSRARRSSTSIRIPRELGFVYEPDLADRLPLPRVRRRAARRSSPSSRAGASGREAARADYEANLRHEPMEGPVDLGEIMALPPPPAARDAIQTCGAGNFTVWAHRFAEFTQYGTQVCPRSGSMGYGVAAAVAAKLVHPDRIALCFTGDGDFVMSSPEFATAVQYELPIVVLLVNNGMYATIRMHQERQFPGRVIGTDLENPDFPALAQAYGGFGERVERTEDFEAAFERALASGKPALLELPVDPGADQPARQAERAAGGSAMSREEIRVDGLAEPISHFTDAVRAGDLLFVSGVVAVDGDGRLVGGDDVVAQARQVFENLRARPRRRRLRLRGRRQGHGLPHGRRRPAADQPRAAGVLRRDAPGVDARRGVAARGPGREGRDRSASRSSRRERRPAGTRSSRAVEPRRGRVPGPLAGRTLAVKDLFDTAGIRTTYGSRLYADHVPERNAVAVERLLDAGAVLVGKTQPAGVRVGRARRRTSGTAPATTPPSPGRTTGGSSSGSAAALAAGLCELALGTDTGLLGPPSRGRLRGRRPQVAVGSDPAATASSRSARRSTRSGRWREASRTSRSCGRCSPARPVPQPRLDGLTVGLLAAAAGDRRRPRDRDERRRRGVGRRPRAARRPRRRGARARAERAPPGRSSSTRPLQLARARRSRAAPTSTATSMRTKLEAAQRAKPDDDRGGLPRDRGVARATSPRSTST